MNSLAPSLVRHPQVRRGQTALCQVLLGDLEVMADIGAFAAEHGVLQPLRIHVVLTVIPPGADNMDETFDYNQIRDHARALAGQRISLIETFAQRLARRCLDAAMVVEAEVRIDKPRAVPGCMAGTRVVLGKA
jgi:dihydroneopterin aldolase